MTFLCTIYTIECSSWTQNNLHIFCLLTYLGTNSFENFSRENLSRSVEPPLKVRVELSITISSRNCHFEANLFPLPQEHFCRIFDMDFCARKADLSYSATPHLRRDVRVRYCVQCCPTAYNCATPG